MKTASRIKLAATVASVVRASTRHGSPSLTERAQAVPRLVRATLERRYAGVTLGRLGLVAGAVAYVASPVDLIPEALLPVLGAADDAVVITWAIKVFFEETDRFISWEIGQGLRRPGASTRRGVAAWSRYASPSGSDASSATVPGSTTGSAVLRRDRDVTGAAAPGRTDTAAGQRAAGSSGAGAGGGRSARARLPEGVRGAATDYVMESVRKRLER